MPYGVACSALLERLPDQQHMGIKETNSHYSNNLSKNILEEMHKVPI